MIILLSLTYPLLSNSMAVAKPMPLAPPVMKATDPLTSETILSCIPVAQLSNSSNLIYRVERNTDTPPLFRPRMSHAWTQKSILGISSLFITFCLITSNHGKLYIKVMPVAFNRNANLFRRFPMPCACNILIKTMNPESEPRWHRAIIVANTIARSELRNTVLVRTKVAYRYIPTAHISMNVSYDLQLKTPKLEGMTIRMVTQCSPYVWNDSVRWADTMRWADWVRWTDTVRWTDSVRLTDPVTLALSSALIPSSSWLLSLFAGVSSALGLGSSTGRTGGLDCWFGGCKGRSLYGSVINSHALYLMAGVWVLYMVIDSFIQSKSAVKATTHVTHAMGLSAREISSDTRSKTQEGCQYGFCFQFGMLLTKQSIDLHIHTARQQVCSSRQAKPAKTWSCRELG